MKTEEQRIAIAEVIWGEKCPHWINPDHKYSDAAIRCMPDVLNDLNACHEMEKVLTMEQASRYGRALAKIADRGVGFMEEVEIGPLDVFAWATFTAAQRAEAFLKALDLWKESK